MLGAGWALCAPALAGGDPAAMEKGGVPLPRAGETEAVINQGQPAAFTIPVSPRDPDDVVYVISGEGTKVYSLRAYLATQDPETGSTGMLVAPAPPETPHATVVEGEPAKADKPVMPASPPGPVVHSEPPPNGAALQTAAGEPAGDGLGGFLSEIRTGVLAHDVGVFGRSKEDGVDVNVELLFVSPDFLDIIFSPRPHVGVSINTEGDTSQVYGGLAWDWTFWDPFFVELALAIAVHDGETNNPGPGEKALGCRALFREAASLGARFLERHSVSVMFSHISNAKLCDNNEGLDNFGVRYGYKF